MTDRKSVHDVCPFDELPCDFVDSCDDVLELLSGVICTEHEHCTRAVFPLG